MTIGSTDIAIFQSFVVIFALMRTLRLIKKSYHFLVRKKSFFKKFYSGLMPNPHPATIQNMLSVEKSICESSLRLSVKLVILKKNIMV